MTPGADGETPHGMSEARIGRIIDALRHERYRFRPVKRTYIPKKNGKRRPLGLPSWSDKIVSEVVRLLLEAYYEGLRPLPRLHPPPAANHDTQHGVVTGKLDDRKRSHPVREGVVGKRTSEAGTSTEDLPHTHPGPPGCFSSRVEKSAVLLVDVSVLALLVLRDHPPSAPTLQSQALLLI